jgi:Domain of unknown function (DUF4116)
MADMRSRLEKILDKHGSALHDAVCQREAKSRKLQLSNKDLVLQFAGADPTDGKSRTQWLAKTYIADADFKLEDLGRAYVALQAFEQFKRKLPIEQRELSKIKSLRKLEALMDPFMKAKEKARLNLDLSSVTGREKRRLEELKAREESIIIQEGNGLATIVSPKTEFAACWWGRGTKWCTAAEKNNAFFDYNNDAPLIILVCPDGEKFQTYLTSNKVTCANALDEHVGKQSVKERWDDFRPLLSWMMEKNGCALCYVPEDYITFDLCYRCVKNNGLALKYVPEKFKTEELCLKSVENWGTALKFVPERYKTPKMCYKSARRMSGARKYIPNNHYTLWLMSKLILLDVKVLIQIMIMIPIGVLCLMLRPVTSGKRNSKVLNHLKTNLQFRHSYIPC